MGDEHKKDVIKMYWWSLYHIPSYILDFTRMSFPIINSGINVKNM